MSEARGDEALRALEREIASGGSTSARIKLAAELERRERPREAVDVLVDAFKRFPDDRDVRLALGKFKGPAAGPWGSVNADARNTRLSPSRGPRGEGRVLSREPIAAYDGERPAPAPPPLVGPGAATGLGSLGGRSILALTADGHVISETLGAGGFLLSSDGPRPWRFHFPNSEQEDEARYSFHAHAAIGPDGTVFGFVRSNKLIAVEPTGEERWRQEIPARVLSVALDAERERLYLAYDHPPLLVALDPRTGAMLHETRMPAHPPAEAIVCNDGRVACVTPFGTVKIVAFDGTLEPIVKVAERIWGAHGALAPWGDLVVVSSDQKGASVDLIDPATGKKKSHFDVSDCFGVPAIDRDGTIYLDGGARGYVLGFDLVSGAQRYKLDRPTLWQQPERPGSSIAIGDGEVAFIDFTANGVEVVLGGAG